MYQLISRLLHMSIPLNQIGTKMYRSYAISRITVYLEIIVTGKYFITVPPMGGPLVNAIMLDGIALQPLYSKSAIVISRMLLLPYAIISHMLLLPGIKHPFSDILTFVAVHCCLEKGHWKNCPANSCSLITFPDFKDSLQAWAIMFTIRVESAVTSITHFPARISIELYSQIY